MEANQLYTHLEDDFITSEMTDAWAQDMDSIADFLCENFKKRSMGLVCDFTTEINRVYTAVFPSTEVMQNVLDGGAQDALLFVHHPAIWDIRQAPNVFQQMERELLQQFKERRIAIYNLHVPLDHFSEYSTSITLAKALGIQPKEAFSPYFGGMAGVFGTTECVTAQELKQRFQKIVNHDVSLYHYGEQNIKEATVAIVAGGGNDVEVLQDVANAGVNTFVTGVTAKNDYSHKAHVYAEENGINLLGGTHYSTEKFACLAMVEYFGQMGLPSEFIEDTPVMEDM